jgi:hypothetical protein
MGYFSCVSPTGAQIAELPYQMGSQLLLHQSPSVRLNAFSGVQEFARTLHKDLIGRCPL